MYIPDPFLSPWCTTLPVPVWWVWAIVDFSSSNVNELLVTFEIGNTSSSSFAGYVFCPYEHFVTTSEILILTGTLGVEALIEEVSPALIATIPVDVL